MLDVGKLSKTLQFAQTQVGLVELDFFYFLLLYVDELMHSFLTDIPDQPTFTGRGRAADTNSLLHLIPLFMLNN